MIQTFSDYGDIVLYEPLQKRVILPGLFVIAGDPNHASPDNFVLDRQPFIGKDISR